MADASGHEVHAQSAWQGLGPEEKTGGFSLGAGVR
jgi:hypothetical protein